MLGLDSTQFTLNLIRFEPNKPKLGSPRIYPTRNVHTHLLSGLPYNRMYRTCAAYRPRKDLTKCPSRHIVPRARSCRLLSFCSKEKNLKSTLYWRRGRGKAGDHPRTSMVTALRSLFWCSSGRAWSFARSPSMTPGGNALTH